MTTHQHAYRARGRLLTYVRLALLVIALNPVCLYAAGSNASGPEEQCRERAGFGPKGYVVRPPTWDAVLICESAALKAQAKSDVLAHLAEAYLRAGRYNEALSVAEYSAASGNPISMSTLGDMYRLGHGVETDNKTSLIWYRRGAEAGNAMAQFQLWDALRMGIHSRDEGANWLRKSAEQGLASAESALGRAYLIDGFGFRKNPTEAAKWLSLAEVQGDKFARRELGRLYAGGVGVPRDTRRAAALWQLGGENGDGAAFYNLARLTQHNDIESRHEIDIENLFINAWRLGDGNAKSVIFPRIRSGAISKENVGRVLDYLKADSRDKPTFSTTTAVTELANKKRSDAEQLLGEIYLGGKLTSYDLKVAAMWLLQATLDSDACNTQVMGKDPQFGGKGNCYPAILLSWLYATHSGDELGARGSERDLEGAVKLFDPEHAVLSSFVLTGFRKAIDENSGAVMFLVLVVVSFGVLLPIGGHLIFNQRSGLPLILPRVRRKLADDEIEILPRRFARLLLVLLIGFAPFVCILFELVPLLFFPSLDPTAGVDNIVGKFADWPNVVGVELIWTLLALLWGICLLLLFVFTDVRVRWSPRAGLGLGYRSRATVIWARPEEIESWQLVSYFTRFLRNRGSLRLHRKDGRSITLPEYVITQLLPLLQAANIPERKT